MSQEREPARTKRSQEAPGGVREAKTQEEPGGARSRHEEGPGGAKSSYKAGARRKREEEVARRKQEKQGGARRSQEEPGEARMCGEEPGGARNSQEGPGGPNISPICYFALQSYTYSKKPWKIRSESNCSVHETCRQQPASVRGDLFSQPGPWCTHSPWACRPVLGMPNWGTVDVPLMPESIHNNDSSTGA